MTDNTMDQPVIKCICECMNLPEAEVTPSSELEADLCCDSLDKTEIIMFLEDEFNISISNEQAEMVNTVQDAINLVISLKGGAA